MPKSSTSPPDAANLPTLLLDWYDRHRRVLPWRAPPGKRADPYHVWLSEIMLQQTTVVTVGPYFRAFLEKWPTVGDLAAAALDDVLTAWAGLGYYARARNLHKCAKVVSEELGGRFPDTEEGLAALPGIGAYTAAAVAAIAHSTGPHPRWTAMWSALPPGSTPSQIPYPDRSRSFGTSRRRRSRTGGPATTPKRSWIWVLRSARPGSRNA